MARVDTGKIGLIVTDLDNTLYDWVSWFVPAFYAMSERAAEILDVDHETLLDELRVVHRHHGSSEHPFSLLETATVRMRLNGMSNSAQREHLDEAFYRFNSVRKHTLKLYGSVSATLEALTNHGIPVVGYTDARTPNSLFRVNRLGLDVFLEHLYAPASRFPSDPSLHEHDEVFLRVLPESDKKPNPMVLLDICRDFAVDPAHTVYIGDSLTRDVYMANTAGARSAWARYGTLSDPTLWEKLVRITHWTEEDVENEARLKMESAGTQPDYILDQFSDLLAHLRI